MTPGRRPTLALALLATVVPGCGDRAPPAMWPEPPPPTLAEPIGVEHRGRAPDPPEPDTTPAADGGNAVAPERDDGATNGSDTGDRGATTAGADTEPARESADRPAPKR